MPSCDPPDRSPQRRKRRPAPSRSAPRRDRQRGGLDLAACALRCLSTTGWRDRARRPACPCQFGALGSTQIASRGSDRQASTTRIITFSICYQLPRNSLILSEIRTARFTRVGHRFNPYTAHHEIKFPTSGFGLTLTFRGAISAGARPLPWASYFRSRRRYCPGRLMPINTVPGLSRDSPGMPANAHSAGLVHRRHAKDDTDEHQ